MYFKTSFTCFVTPVSSAEVPCEFLEGCKIVAFSLLWSIQYLPGDGGCGKKGVVSGFCSAISVDSFSFRLLNVLHVFRCLISVAKQCICFAFLTCFCFRHFKFGFYSFLFVAMLFQISFSLLPLVSFEYQIVGRFCCLSLLFILLKFFLMFILLILQNKFDLLVPLRRAVASDICLVFGSCSSGKSSARVMCC